jgi:hypothetical protein
MLKSGMMEDGLVHVTEEGTAQGLILSPPLSNVYLHYVLDLWFSCRVCKRPHFRELKPTTLLIWSDRCQVIAIIAGGKILDFLLSYVNG